jgi:hypothetical protein
MGADMTGGRDVAGSVSLALAAAVIGGVGMHAGYLWTVWFSGFFCGAFAAIACEEWRAWRRQRRFTP